MVIDDIIIKGSFDPIHQKGMIKLWKIIQQKSIMKRQMRC